MRNLLLFCVVLIVLCSCKKENHKNWTTIKLQGTNFISNDAIPARIIISGSRFVYPWKSHLITDHYEEDGNFEVGFKGKSNSSWDYSYKFEYDYEKYFLLSGNHNIISFRAGEHFDANMKFVEFGIMDFKLTNLNCENFSDAVELNITSEYQNQSLNHVIFDPINGNGCPVNTPWFNRKVPAGKYYLNYTVSKQTGITSYQDTVIVQENETLEYNLIF